MASWFGGPPAKFKVDTAIGTGIGFVGSAAASSGSRISTSGGASSASPAGSVLDAAAFSRAVSVIAPSCEIGAALPGSCLFGIARGGPCGPFSRTSLCLLCSSASLSVGSHWLCSGTPSAGGSSPAASRSWPQKEGRWMGAGVTGREGRSISVGKSVILRLLRRSGRCDGEGSAVMDGSPVLTVPWGLLQRTWTLARRFWGRLAM